MFYLIHYITASLDTLMEWNELYNLFVSNSGENKENSHKDKDSTKKKRLNRYQNSNKKGEKSNKKKQKQSDDGKETANQKI